MMNPAAAHMLFAYPAGAMHPQFAMHPMFLTPAVAAALMRQGMVMTAIQAPLMPESIPEVKPEQQQLQQQQPLLAAFDPHLAALHHQASDAAAALMSLSAHRPPTAASADALASLCKPSARRTSSGSEQTFKLLSGLTDSGDQPHATPFPCSLVLKTSASSAFKPASGSTLRV
jgi:hypothetical protein